MSAAGVNIAIVDDDDRVGRSLARLLRAAGFFPTSYSSAEEFLRTTTGRRPDCVLLDIQLGGMSGLELQDRLAAQEDSPPIILITAYATPETTRRAHEAGCVDLLHKPVTQDVLLEAVRRALGTDRTEGA